MDTSSLSLPPRDHELLYSREWVGVLFICPKRICVSCTSDYILIMSMLTFISLVFTFVMPIGLGSIGWKMYMINASWDLVILGLIVCI